jgi:hypothetical protein
MKTTGDDAQWRHGEYLATLAAFGGCPYVKVLIHIYFFQGCQDCQLPLPGTLRWHPWQPSETAAGNKLAPLGDMWPLVTAKPAPAIGTTAEIAKRGAA